MKTKTLLILGFLYSLNAQAAELLLGIGRTISDPHSDGTFTQQAGGYDAVSVNTSPTYSIGVRFESGRHGLELSYIDFGNYSDFLGATTDANYNPGVGCFEPCEQTTWLYTSADVKGISAAYTYDFIQTKKYSAFVKGGIIFTRNDTAIFTAREDGPPTQKTFDGVFTQQTDDSNFTYGIGFEYNKWRLVYDRYENLEGDNYIHCCSTVQGVNTFLIQYVIDL